jgi:hypothetical protein
LNQASLQFDHIVVATGGLTGEIGMNGRFSGLLIPSETLNAESAAQLQQTTEYRQL